MGDTRDGSLRAGLLTDGEMLALGMLIIGDAASVITGNQVSRQLERHAPGYFESAAYNALEAELRRRGVLPEPARPATPGGKP